MSFICNGKNYIISQVNGQRITSLRGWLFDSENSLEEIYIGNLPRNMSEEDLMPILCMYGDVLQLRLMMCYSGLNRGFGFLIYSEQTDLNRIISMLQNKQIGNSRMYATKSHNISELVIRNISILIETKTIINLVTEHTYPQVMRFIIDTDYKNVIIKYPTHREAALAKRSLVGNIYSFGPEASIKWHAESHP